MKLKSFVLIAALALVSANTCFANSWEEEAQKADAARAAKDNARVKEEAPKEEAQVEPKEERETLSERYMRLNGWEKTTSGFRYGIGGGFGSNTAQDSSLGLSLSATNGSFDARGNLLFGMDGAKDQYGKGGAGYAGVLAGNNLRFDCLDEKKPGWCITPVGNAFLLKANSKDSSKFFGAATLNGTRNKGRYSLTIGGGIGGFTYAKPRSKDENSAPYVPTPSYGAGQQAGNYDEMLGLALNAGAFGKFVNDKMSVGVEGTMIVRPGLILTRDSDSPVRGGAYVSARGSYQFGNNWAALANLDVPVSKVKDASGVTSTNGTPELYLGVEYRPKMKYYKKSYGRSVGSDDAKEDDKDEDDHKNSDE